jgi:UDP-glucose 4-epimerase
MNDAACVLVTFADSAIGHGLISALCAQPWVQRVVAVHASDTTLDRSAWDERVAPLSVDLHHARQTLSALHECVSQEGVTCLVHDPSAISSTLRRMHASTELTRALLDLAQTQVSVTNVVIKGSSRVYRFEASTPVLVDEDHPLAIAPHIDLRTSIDLETDALVCSQMLRSRVNIALLRCAEILAPDADSELFDYLQAPVCFRQLGYDPMLNVLDASDCVRALLCAVRSRARGVFNIPGKDVLPLSELIAACRRRWVALPAALLEPLYALRKRVMPTVFDYPSHARRFRYSGVLDGARARRELGYVPEHAIDFSTLAEQVRGHAGRPRGLAAPARS